MNLLHHVLLLLLLHASRARSVKLPIRTHLFFLLQAVLFFPPFHSCRRWQQQAAEYEAAVYAFFEIEKKRRYDHFRTCIYSKCVGMNGRPIRARSLTSRLKRATAAHTRAKQLIEPPTKLIQFRLDLDSFPALTSLTPARSVLNFG